MLAEMVGAMLVETTVGAIMSALEAQKLSLPAMYEKCLYIFIEILYFDYILVD